MTRLFLLAPFTLLLVPVFFRLRKRYIRNKYPRDYAYYLFQQAEGPDYYPYLKSRIPRLTPTRYTRLVLDFRAVDATLSTIALRQAGEPFSSKTAMLALRQLHPFLKYEGLRQAVRIARSRHSNLERTKAPSTRIVQSPARTSQASSDA